MMKRSDSGVAVAADGGPGKSGQASAEERISVRHVSKVFFSAGGKFLALDDVSLSVGRGEFVGLVGPSGCGKSTLMNIIVGLETAERGEVSYNGKRIDGLNSEVGYMTQKDTLLPWRDVITNLMLPLRLRGVGRTEAHERASSWLSLVGLERFGHHMPSELSGGMLKRAALARTLVAEPDTVLMDEPFGNVDAQIRIQLHQQLMQLCSAQGCTVVFVTHDLEEAVSLCDRVVVLSPQPGRIAAEVNVELARPRDPATVRFTAGFQEIHSRLWDIMMSGGGAKVTREGQ